MVEAKQTSILSQFFTVVLMTFVAVVYMRWQGRIWWCECGEFYPISLGVQSRHCSQHLFDAYTVSHVLHGLWFFGMLWPLRNRISLGWRFVIASAIEIAWEMLENSPAVIEHYRNETAALGYTGDSILNSLCDILSCMVGFYIALRIGLWKSVALFIASELLMLWLIRDNLTLNVLMLLWPIDAIRQWQTRG
jgi:hypothetical protein